MLTVKDIQLANHKDTSQCTAYRDAVAFFTLSRKLSKNNLCASKWRCLKQRKLAAHLTENISTSALSLPMTIAEASITVDYGKKLFFKNTIEERVEKILSLCNNLEDVYQPKDKRAKQLYRAANKLQAGVKKWSLHLTSQN
ncbi:hypothetical protein [Dokdonia donghaensis]|uniref:Uncharacterized protein n=1 Tax=Dokdonia donghaensis DSW-1 TaxID=1300343 RepID=A0A0A2GT67_9FLAO|nr:hypothetical protein [Dokdonia donghaensis]ANH61304.1 hypothetical protein I597_2407 [Dokdonia donghaensis DSW-1]KGO05501.1 hypothetical protein NV36_00660 [Dokdonia donghaensis DSW-1]